MSDDSQDEKQIRVEILKESEKAWLTAFFSSPAGHRQAAQNAYTIAAAVAAAIVAAGALSGILSAWVGLQIAVGGVVALWLLVAWMFMHAAGTQPKVIPVDEDEEAAEANRGQGSQPNPPAPGSSPAPDSVRPQATRGPVPQTTSYTGDWTGEWMVAAELPRPAKTERMPKPNPLTGTTEVFVEKAMKRTWAERKSIAEWSGKARLWAAIAIVATVIALAFAILADRQGWSTEHEVQGVLALSRGGAAALLAVCDPKMIATTTPSASVGAGAKLRETRVDYGRDASAKVRSTKTTTSVPTTGVMYAWVRPSTLDDAIVKVRFGPTHCEAATATVRLRKSQIRAFQTSD